VSLAELESKEIKDWSFEETKAVMEILLVACKPLLTKQELSSQIFHRVVIFDGEKSFLPSNYHSKLELATDRKLMHCASEKRVTVAGGEDMSKQAKEELCR
jgi:hypothetical protein